MRNGFFLFFGIALAVGASLLTGSEAAVGMEPRTLQQIRAANAFMSATDFLDICRSAETEKLAYCMGYLRGAVFFWQEKTACGMAAPDAQAFCAGAGDARTKAAEVMDSMAALKNPRGLNPDEEKAEEKRLRAARANAVREMREKLGTCAPGPEHSALYCQAYNAQAEFQVISPVMNPQGPEAGPDSVGLADAVGAEFPFMFASKEAYRFRPCLSPNFTAAEARNALLAFIDAHPEQQKGKIAFELIGRALYYTVCPARVNMLPNMEQCLEWTSPGGMFGAKNTCSQAITIRFMTIPDEHIVEATVQPGEFFRSGLTVDQEKSTRWLFTACPKGSPASIRFDAADPAKRGRNRQDIIDGGYECGRHPLLQ